MKMFSVDQSKTSKETLLGKLINAPTQQNKCKDCLEIPVERQLVDLDESILSDFVDCVKANVVSDYMNKNISVRDPHKILGRKKSRRDKRSQIRYIREIEEKRKELGF